MVIVFALITIDCRFDPLLGQTKLEFVASPLSTSSSKSKHRLARGQDNVPEERDMSISDILFDFH